MSFSFRRLAVALVVVVAAVGATGASLAATARQPIRSTCPPDCKLVGQKLVNSFYADIQKRNFPALRKIILGAVFRSLAANGAPLDRAAFISWLDRRRLRSFGLRDVHAAAARGVLVATYQMKGTWVVGGKTVTVPWSARLLTAREILIEGSRTEGGYSPYVITSVADFCTNTEPKECVR